MNSRPVVAGIAYHQPDLFRFALDEARRLDCGVRVSHVNSVTELQDLRGSEEELFDKLRATAASESDPPPVDYLWWWGDPAEVLITESREASEVVIGVDEGTWLSKVAGGEVARKVALNAACPVVVYPTGGRTDGRNGHVVVAVDTSEPVEAPLRYAFEAARRRHEPLHVVEASGTGSDYPERERGRNRLEAIVDPSPAVPRCSGPRLGGRWPGGGRVCPRNAGRVVARPGATSPPSRHDVVRCDRGAGSATGSRTRGCDFR